MLFATLAGCIFLASCSDDDDPQNNIQLPLGAYDNGVLILNQGNFNGGNSEVSYLSNDFATFQNGIFGIVNEGDEMGDTGQDIGFYNDLAFIVMNNSASIQIVNRYTFASVGTITEGLSNPRYIAFANGKAYVTNWGNPVDTTDDYVAVINLSTLQVISNIPVAEGPERIIEENGKLYVAQTGGYGYGNSITVISAATNAVTKTITVGDVPNSMEIENGTLYVICGGKPIFAPVETAGQLTKISLASETVTGHIDFAAGKHPMNLEIEDGALYYTVDADIFKSTPGAATLPSAAFFSTTSQGVYGVYALEVENGKIFVADAVDYNSNGKVYVYSTSGAMEHEYTVGVIPAGFYFN